MDTDNLIAHGRSRFEHAAAKRTLKEKYQSKLIFAYNGGMFKATKELLTFLNFCESSIEIVLTDLYDNPIKVNVHAITTIAEKLYQEQMNTCLTEYDQLNKNR